MSFKKSVLAQAVGSALLLAAANSKAQVTMAIDTSSLSSLDEYAGISASLAGYGPIITSGADWIGIYEFNIAPGSSPPVNSPFYSVCLSPIGSLPGGNQTYNLETFGGANPGINSPGTPGSWAWNGNSSSPQYWGVQNATYLFSMYSAAIIQGDGAATWGLTGSSADQGTALALAMYAALYNSTGYGLLGNSYFDNTSTVGAVNTDYWDILSALGGTGSPAAVAAQTITGGVLVPTDPSSQEFELLSCDLPQGFGVVPEPTTLIAGALLLIPFGASTLRIMRKGRIS